MAAASVVPSTAWQRPRSNSSSSSKCHYVPVNLCHYGCHIAVQQAARLLAGYGSTDKPPIKMQLKQVSQ
jgi:hypothetical protein